MYTQITQVAEKQGNYLQTYLRMKRVNLTTLAEKMGISRSTLYNMFEEDVLPPDKIEQLSDLTGFVAEAGQMYDSEKLDDSGVRTVFVTVDQEKNEIIKIVSEKAKAGYLKGDRDQEYWESLKTAVLPEGKFSEATMRGFEIEGDSMSPRINHGDTVYCSYIEPNLWFSLKEFYVYVIVTQNDIFCKRIRSRIKQDETLLCYSDNMEYEPFPLDAADIKEIWRVRRLYSGNLSKIK
jgi:phage repressor protein C with HTH and peptisase S24 domain/predicted DNA-binding transcriptional regulator AlpA